MVSTRHHPRDFPPPGSATRSASPPSSPSTRGSATAKTWAHTPSAAVTIWLVVSIPLVLWDSGYVLLRPHSMPGNNLHAPLWTPYALYGTIDHMYGWPAYNARNGFTAAQTVLNLVETLAYLYYLVTVYRHGTTTTSTSRRSQRKVQKGLLWLLKDEKVVHGRKGAIALLVAYSASLMTLGKTIIYCEFWLVAFPYVIS
ncbi:hypothetical protein EYZ11_003509 [Aspergillus tanneri]|uniref:EXPERA domain-containing protein n=1 Tax=Aspergillus tanneri TaxID=1220188 RepID=A0A4S3JNA1_9EURO|nr:hypothetical protein EYZ11_003509 [Aspergillus tanneri]